MYGGDEVNAVVLDVGSSSTKAGYAGEDAPKALFPSSCGVISRTENGGAAEPAPDGAAAKLGKQKQRPVTASGRVLYTGGQDVSYRRQHMEVLPALQGGLYNDWELIESIWHHTFSERLRLDPREHPMLLAEPTANAQDARTRATELMFEKFAPPALFLAKNAVLSSFASGRQTSLIVDLGHEATVTAAVHDGYVLQRSVVQTPVGGQALTQALLASAQRQGQACVPHSCFQRTETSPGHFQVRPLRAPDVTDSFVRFHTEALAADVKESICRVSDAAFDAEANANLPTVDYELPDGNILAVGPDRFNVPELLFKPSLLDSYGLTPTVHAGQQLVSVPAAVMRCIELCDVDVRKDMYGGILPTGGTALLPQLRERLEKEVGELAPPAVKVKVTAPVNTLERRFSVWIGGSILASLGNFQQMWMSKQEYEEHGASLIHRRAP